MVFVASCRLPVGACTATASEYQGKEVPFLTLAECQSPLAQYLGLPVPGVTKQNDAQRFHLSLESVVTPAGPVPNCELPVVQIAPQMLWGWTHMQIPVPMPVPMPSPYEVQQQFYAEWLLPAGDQSFTAFGSSSESGDNDSSKSTQASASTAGRQRRQHAAVTAAEPCSQSHSSSSSKARRLNYADLIRKLGAGETTAAIAEIRGNVQRLTFEASGCRIVQSVLEKADQQSAAELVSELHGCVRRAISSPHGNYVIQKVVEVLPIALSRFVVNELLEDCSGIVRHRFGCRAMCRILEHSGGDSMEINTWMMANEVVKEAADLLLHNFGHHVIESLLEHGLPEHKHQIALALHANLAEYVTDRHATYIIESALKECSMEDQLLLISALVCNSENLLWIAENQSGFHIVKALLTHSTETRNKTLEMLQPATARLQSSQNGFRVIQEMCAYQAFPVLTYSKPGAKGFRVNQEMHACARVSAN